MCYVSEERTLNQSIALVTDLDPVFPPMVKGDSDNQRTGDIIQPISLNIKGILELIQNTTFPDTASRILVRLIVLENKAVRGYDGNPTNPDTDFLDNLIDFGTGQSLVSGGTGGIDFLRSAFLPLNKNACIVHYDKLYYLNIPKVINPLGTQQNNISYEKTVKYFNINIKVPSKATYTDDSNYPSNFGPYLCACYFPMNGDSNGNLGLIKISAITRLVYQDV